MRLQQDPRTPETRTDGLKISLVVLVSVPAQSDFLSVTSLVAPPLRAKRREWLHSSTIVLLLFGHDAAQRKSAKRVYFDFTLQWSSLNLSSV